MIQLTDNLFDIRAGNIRIDNPVVLSAMAGITDADYALSHGKDAGLVILGAYNLDEEAVSAAKEVIARGRPEFVFEDPLGKILEEIEKYRAAAGDDASQIAISCRSATIGPLVEAAKVFEEKRVIMELDLHCRQPEFTKRGMGQGLLEKPETMIQMIEDVKDTGVVLSVKIRADVVPNEIFVQILDALGADIIHIDAMSEGAGANPGVIAACRDATTRLIIANNSVRSFDDAKEFFSRGADMVSVARGSSDENLIPSLSEKTEKYQKETGWYNSPSHICKGGDRRGLAFCCPPVKHCALRKKLEEVGFEPQDFINLKLSLVNGTPLEGGDFTCFGSMAWCCKASKPCYTRDMAIAEAGITPADYMRYKKQMADAILRQIEMKKLEAALAEAENENDDPENPGNDGLI